MLRYLLRRVLYAVPVLLGVSLATFILFYGIFPPEQIARRNLSAKNPTSQQIQEWLVAHDYNHPLPQQFKKHMTELMLLRFGRSDSTGEEIWTRIKTGAGPSTIIAGLVFTASLATRLFFALWSAYFRATYVDTWITLVSVFLMSVVYIVLVIAGQYLMGKVLRLFPLAGYQSGWTAFRFAVLPVIIGVISGLGGGTRLFRTFMLEEMNQDYVRTARAKGVPESRILFVHVLKNAAIPIITSTVLAIPALMLGSLVLESFFGIPGLGSYTVDAINAQDFAVVRAMVFLGTLLYIAGAILTDVCYALADPRIRLE
ncbi:oligopeptide transport system permease protein OppB [Abditibacteriota bacterium]|nr:oligopeptide transport system permease protein OppB [Abditibacteriota bacterium]